MTLLSASFSEPAVMSELYCHGRSLPCPTADAIRLAGHSSFKQRKYSGERPSQSAI